MRILVSGFEAFGGASINPSQKLIEALRSGDIHFDGEVETILLPVEFGKSFTVLEKEIVRVKPDVVLALGQAGGRESIALERVALNLVDKDMPDNRGGRAHDETIVKGGENALFSTLPLDDMREALKAENIPVQVSYTAGLYVCNDLFYRLQRLGHPRSGFVHVPFLPEQTSDLPTMTFEMMKRALGIMLTELQK